MYPYIGGVAASHALDARNGYNLTFNGGVTHNEYGVQGNGTNGYADTGFDIGSAYPGLAHSAGVYINLQGTGNRIYDLGLENPNTGQELKGMISLAAKRASGVGNSTLYDQGDFSAGRVSTTAESTASGMTIGTAESSSKRELYRDGVNIASQNFPAESLDVYAGINIFLYAFHAANGANYFSDNRQGFCFIGSGMTSSEVSTLSDIINDYQTSLGRNVY
jgi:hypothetical protein